MLKIMMKEHWSVGEPLEVRVALRYYTSWRFRGWRDDRDALQSFRNSTSVGEILKYQRRVEGQL